MEVTCQWAKEKVATNIQQVVVLNQIKEPLSD